MKHVLLFLNLLFFVAYTKAQSPNWQWAQQAGGNSYEYLGGGYFNADGGMAIDSVGNIYITGGFSSDTMHFGSSPIARSGPSYNVWLAKYSPAGIFLWAVSTGGAATVGVTGITLSTDGEPIITGSFNGDTLRFGSIELYGSESEDIYVAKFSPTGAPIWARHYGGSGSDFPGTITCDSNDNLYVCGSFYSPTLNLGTISLVNPAVCNGFLAKLDAAGLPVWAVTTGDGGTVQTCRIGLDDTGNIYISGTFAIDTITFGSTLLVPFSNGGNAKAEGSRAAVPPGRGCRDLSS